MTTTTTSTNKPAAKLRDGNLHATIWANGFDKGPSHSVRFTRTWRDDAGQYHDVDTFSGSQLLRLARLAERAYDVIAEELIPDAAKGDWQ